MNATIEYVGAIQTHLLQFVAQHTPRAVARLLPTAAHSQRRHDRAAVNGTARTGIELSDLVHVNGSNGHVHPTEVKPNDVNEQEEDEEEEDEGEDEGDDDDEEGEEEQEQEGENNVDKQD